MTPWELAGKSEHSHQRALFCWANCAAVYGFAIANSAEGYTKNMRELLLSTGPDIAPVPALLRLFAVHNQGHGDAIRGARAKAEGVKVGVPDLCLPVVREKPDSLNRGFKDMFWHGLFIELKLPGYTPSAVKPEQREWQGYLRQQGYRAEICGGWGAAAKVIQDYMS